jgi:diaminohydroxyphosphoribosylaminopyrimidine deaminase / 5-amino-6-(5-phosphoribosylamino)uracil reductase
MIRAGDKISTEEAMTWALEIGRRGAGFVAPNPLVGCVILDREMQVIGFGHHAELGGDHAEIAALKSIDDPRRLDGAHVIVTLEPCAHHGRTPPCSEALARLKLARVVYAIDDPNPKVAGKGAAMIRAAGIQVERLDAFRERAEELAEIFLHNMREKKAFLAVKVASTLDGQMAMKNGASQWISGEESRREAHFLRGTHDAVMVGKRTFLVDDPGLDCRHPDFAGRANKVIVIDPRGEALARLPQSRLAKAHAPENIIWAVAEGVTSKQPVQLWHLPHRPAEGLSIQNLAETALERGITSILVEGGAHLIGRLLESGRAQRWYQFIAPDLLGGREALSVGAAWGVPDLERKVKLRNPSWRVLGRDILVTGRLA